MRNSHWLTCTLLLGMACSSGESTGAGPARPPSDEPVPEGRDLPPADDFGVRFSGGETADFGNGDQRTCDERSFATETVLSDEQAVQEGLDMQAERAWLAAPHGVALRWNPAECAATSALHCDETRIELRAEVIEVLRVEWQEGEWDHAPHRTELCGRFAYRLAVNVRSEDGNLAGTFYARVPRLQSAAGVITVTGWAIPDLRNFEGSLPINVDLTRPQHAYLEIEFSLVSDGTAAGRIDPSISYYDELAPYNPRIAPEAYFAPVVTDERFADYSQIAADGTDFTLSTYPGSSIAPLVDLRVRAEGYEPVADVDLTIQVDGEEVHAESVATGTYVELGRHPFGTTVSVDVHNTNGASQVGANVLQDDCFVGASSSCSEQDCTTHVEYTAAPWLCFD
jgi:hypothetical protein